MDVATNIVMTKQKKGSPPPSGDYVDPRFIMFSCIFLSNMSEFLS